MNNDSAMQRLERNSAPLGGSNQRSVIAKSVSSQVVTMTETEPDRQLYEPVERLQPDPDQVKSYQKGHHLSPHSPPSELSPCCGSPPPHPAILANCNYINYDLYSGYELLKGKRKPIPVPSESKDDAYWERRRRNNESAKRSREIRRIKEVQTNTRISYLEQENVKLQAEISFLREEIKRLRENELLPYFVRRVK